MSELAACHVELVLHWRHLDGSAGLRRNSTGFRDVKTLAEQATRERPLAINAFLYAFLCSAKNLDLFLKENVEAIARELAGIEEKMKVLESFEREARPLPDPGLLKIYLSARNWVARKAARDERRTLATLLFSGPSTAEQIARDLGISEDLASRNLRVLATLVEEQEPGVFALHSDADTLAVVLQLLRSTLGLDPIRVLRRRIEDRKSEAAA